MWTTTATVGSGSDALIYRVAREALRNARAHAEARSVQVNVTRHAPDTTGLLVEDGGRGCTNRDQECRRADGHLALRPVGNLARQARGTLSVHSEPERRTIVELVVPSR